jgi:hypothetical protein
MLDGACDATMRQNFLKLLDDTKFIPPMADDMGMNGILPYVIKTQSYEVVIYGASSRGYTGLCWLKSKGIEPLCMADADIGKNGTNFFGVEVVHIDFLAEKIRGKKIYAIVCTDSWGKFEDRFYIENGLRLAGCKKVEYLARLAGTYSGYWSMYYKTHKNDLVWLYDELCDEESRTVLYEFVHSVIYDRGYDGTIFSVDEKYFAPDIYNWLDSECFVDCGAYIGDTIFTLLHTKGTFKKIYAIEADMKYLKIAKENAAMLPQKIREKIEFYHAFLNDEHKAICSLDNILKNSEVTLIKTDIEGKDLEAIKGAEGIIREQKPVLAISAYHKKEDLVKIPAFIKSVSNDYKLYLRKYPPASFIELVLYAVPPGRIR